MQKRLTFLAPFAVAACLALPAVAQDEIPLDRVVATVGDTEITLGHMMVARAGLPQQYQQLPDDVLFTGILDQLVQQEALAQSFEGELPPRATLSLENERRSVTAGEVIEKVMGAPISDEELQAAYAEQYSSAEPEDEYNASHILVETEEAAIALKTELDGGADFATMARERSTGPSGPSGGSLGWFGKGAMVPEFENAVVDMEVGAVSEPVQTQFGWHVIKLNEKRKTETEAFDNVREELELQIRQTKAQEFIDGRTARADVDRSGAEGIDPAVLRQLERLE